MVHTSKSKGNLLKCSSTLNYFDPCSWCCSARLAKVCFKLVSFGRIESPSPPPVIFMSSLLQYLFRMYSISQKPCSAIYVARKANIHNFTFSYSSENRLLHLIQKPAYPHALKIARPSSSLCRFISISCMVKSHSLILLANGSINHGKTSRSSRSLKRTFMSSFTGFSCST